MANKLTPAGWPGRVVENRGYEPYAYFQFFIDNYDNLPDVCVCVQGNPWDHLKRSSFDQILTALEAQRMWFLPLNGDGHSAWQTPDGGPSHPGLGAGADQVVADRYGARATQQVVCLVRWAVCGKPGGRALEAQGFLGEVRRDLPHAG